MGRTAHLTPEERYARHKSQCAAWTEAHREGIRAYKRMYNALIQKWNTQCREAARDGRVPPPYPLRDAEGKRVLPKIKSLQVG